MDNCSYCNKPIRGRYWIGRLSSGQQCDRILCRLRTGHFSWGLGIKVHWRKFTVKVPFKITKRS